MQEKPKITFKGEPDISRIEKCISSILSRRHGENIVVKLERVDETNDKTELVG